MWNESLRFKGIAFFKNKLNELSLAKTNIKFTKINFSKIRLITKVKI